MRVLRIITAAVVLFVAAFTVKTVFTKPETAYRISVSPDLLKNLSGSVYARDELTDQDSDGYSILRIRSNESQEKRVLLSRGAINPLGLIDYNEDDFYFKLGDQYLQYTYLNDLIVGSNTNSISIDVRRCGPAICFSEGRSEPHQFKQLSKLENDSTLTEIDKARLRELD